MQPLIRRSTPADRDAILAFVTRMGFNPRDAVTWDGLHMWAMTAWLGDRLIGAIPLEPRPLKVSPVRTVGALHETVVAVDPEFRSGGLGTRLQQAILEQAAREARLITVFREDPASPAYRWYVKNGFTRATQIQTWASDDPTKLADGAMNAWAIDDPALPWAQIEQRWAVQSQPGGVVDRGRRPLRAWLAVHPYRNRYRFQLVADTRGGYGLVGVGTMHSDRPRCEILELMPAAASVESAESIFRATAAFAARERLVLRLPLAAGDPLGALMSRLGARIDWSFDMLVRPLTDMGVNDEQTGRWRYAGVDFI